MPEQLSLKLGDVLVTGGHGFIGQHVVAALAHEGANPVSVAQSSGTMLAHQPGKSIAMDLEDRDRVKDVVGDMDRVVHLAARAGGIQFQKEGGSDVFASNRLITDNLLAACAEANLKRVFLASSLVTYRAASEPLTESHAQLGPADRPDPYAWSKISDEVMASWHEGLDSVVGRFGNVYGPGASFVPERSTVVHALIDRAARLGDNEDFVVWGDGDAVRSFVFVEDAAEAVLIALTDGEPGEAYNVDSGIEVSIGQLADTVRRYVNPSLNIVHDHSKPAGAPYRVASIAKLAAIGFAPRVELDEGIRRTVEWYRESVASA